MTQKILRPALAVTLCLLGCIGHEPVDDTEQSPAAVGTPGALNTTLVGRIDFGADQNTRDFALSGAYAYVARRGDGVAVVDISNRAAPTLVTLVNPSPGAMDVRDVSVETIAGVDYLFVASNSGVSDPLRGNFTGVYIYSLASRAAPALVSALTWGAGAGYHLAAQTYTLTTATIGGRAYLFAGSSISSSVEVVDVTDPVNPMWLTEIIRHNVSYSAQVCSVVVRNNKLYVAWRVGFAVYDVSGLPAMVQDYYDPPQPPTLVSKLYTGAATNTAVPNATGDYVLTIDDVTNARVRMWDVRNPLAVTQVSAFGGSTNTIARQVFVQGDLAWVTHHEDGLRVFDISTPTAPVNIGWFDTDTSPLSNERVGGWDVIPDGTTAWMTDTADGLHAINLQDTLAVQSAVHYRQNQRLIVYATSSLQPRPTLTAVGFGPMTWVATRNRYEILAPTSVYPGTVTITSSFGASLTVPVTRHN